MDSCLFVFDYARYRAEVVPGFARLLRDGVAAGWMEEIRERERAALGLESYWDGALRLSDGATLDDFLYWFRRCVAERCLGERQFLGRAVDCSFYWGTLRELGAAGRVRELLERLGRRGVAEGIEGWLDPGETRELGEELFRLDLPLYECSFGGMGAFRVMRNLAEGTGRELVLPAYEHPECSFERLSLSFVRTVCQLAAREGKGVLWGVGLG